MQEVNPQDAFMEDAEYERVDYERRFNMTLPLGLMPAMVVSGHYAKKPRAEQASAERDEVQAPAIEKPRKLKSKSSRPPEQRMSFLTHYLWNLAIIGAVIVGTGELFKYTTPDYRYPTPEERAQLDRELRPAAIDAAKIAVRTMTKDGIIMYAEPPKSALQKPRAAEITVEGRNGYNLDVTMQKNESGWPDYKTVYDVTLDDAAGDSLSISSISSENSGVTPDFSYAEPVYGQAVDFNIEIPSGHIKPELREAAVIAQQLKEDLKYFPGSK